MKKLFVLLTFVFAFNANAQYDSFGDKVKPQKAIAAEDFAKKPVEDKSVKLTGTVESVCQVKGCWMKVKLADGSTMRVTFKDYGFFVPKDITNKEVVFEGIAKVKVTPVDELKHYAEDAGKTKEEIAKITEPEKALSFVANGVLVKKD